MTAPQIGIFVLIGAMLVGFGFGRIRYEVVALSGLAAGVLLGFVPSHTVFQGFSSPTVITVIEILLIVEALRGSHLVGMAAGAIPWLGSDRRLIVVSTCAMAALLSAFMNNIGALALMMPLATAMCERYRISLRDMLMPLSFATLLGGLCTIVGTPANLIGSDFLSGMRGYPLGFFELLAVGLPLTLAGLAYIYVITPGASPDESDGADGDDLRVLVREAVVPAGSALAGRSVGDIRAGEDIAIHNIVRDGRFVFGDQGRIVAAGDLLVLTAARSVIRKSFKSQLLDRPDGRQTHPEHRYMEAVVLPDSIYVGSPVENLFMSAASGISVEALGIAPRRIEGRLADVRLAVGDVVALRGDIRVMDAECAESGLLKLADVADASHPKKGDFIPLGAFVLAIAAAAFGGIDPALAFGAVVVVLALTGNLSIRRGLEGMPWPSIVMLASMIPLGLAVATTGAAAALADLVLQVVPAASGFALSVFMLMLAVLLTPFVNNPSTVIVLAPIGAAVAERYGLPAQPVIIAIIVGASLDFTTPFGHHNNTLVMGVGGYSFRDFLRIGAPLVGLSVLVTLACLHLYF